MRRERQIIAVMSDIPGVRSLMLLCCAFAAYREFTNCMAGPALVGGTVNSIDYISNTGFGVSFCLCSRSTCPSRAVFAWNIWKFSSHICPRLLLPIYGVATQYQIRSQELWPGWKVQQNMSREESSSVLDVWYCIVMGYKLKTNGAFFFFSESLGMI